MKILPLLLAIPILFMVGCCGTSMVEREEFTTVESRDKFILENPESNFIDNIRNGEIVRGMNENEVIASWGMPNVYLVSNQKPEDYWVYYIQDDNTNSVMVYTLTFDQEAMLMDWDIDMKRFASYSLGYGHLSEGTNVERKVPVGQKTRHRRAE
jgi:hypothetical protein